MEVQLLTDKSRLAEVYQLRATSYEDSPNSNYVNTQAYPDGYFDDLDILPNTLHWIIEEEGKIIGSVRAAIIDNVNDLHEDLSSLDFPEERPFAYCGRTAVHPQYRKSDAMRLLDKAVRQYLESHPHIKFGFCYVTPERLNAVKRLGFRSIGSCIYDWGEGKKSNLEALVWKHTE